jgi:uncharacterized phage protein (TIGR01671 family)
MREIKFRGKRIDNGEWVYGDLVKTYDVDTKKYFYHIVDEHDSLKFNSTDYQYDTHYEVDPNTVGQFTGLQDKNGVDVYEGDKIKCLDGYGEYYYETTVSSCGTYTIEVTTCDYDYTSLIFAEENGDVQEFEVIGNIHEEVTNE